MGVPEKNNRAFVGTAIVIVVGVLATTLAQPQVLARIPLQNLLKNELHVHRTANVAFFFWAGLAWYLAIRGNLHRCLPDLWQSPQELHSDQHNPVHPFVGWIVFHAL